MIGQAMQSDADNLYRRKQSELNILCAEYTMRDHSAPETHKVTLETLAQASVECKLALISWRKEEEWR